VASYRQGMSTTLEAVYENGLLRLANPLPLPNHARVTVTVQTPDDDGERLAWLKLSEAALAKTWDNPADDVFNALLQK
jgi:predicted DNA-binding antitoxin AbrB/MazE fold protein